MIEMNVESFDLDHTKMVVPSVRLVGAMEGLDGDVIHRYDVRFKQPNKEHMDMPGLHSSEHLMVENIRNHNDKVADLSPMGCQTGFHVSFVNHGNYDDVLNIAEAALNNALNTTKVPTCNEVQRGRATSRPLEGAKTTAQAFLDKRSEWHDVSGIGK